jgi:hypothetical protein
MTPGTVTLYDCEACGTPVGRDVAREWKHADRHSPCADLRPVPVPFTVKARVSA